MSKQRFGLIIVFFTINLISINCIFVNSNISCSNNNIVDSTILLPSDIVFEYNSTFSHEEFVIDVSNLRLGSFNSLILFFETVDYSSNSEGIKVTFIFDQTEITFEIETMFQDTLMHNKTQAFSYPDEFEGNMYLTIICEAQTDYQHHAGSLIIRSSTQVEEIIPSVLSEYPTQFPVIPDWLEFKVGPFSLRTRSIQTVINNTLNFEKLNFTTSFSSSDFSSLERFFEIEVNGKIVASCDFRSNQVAKETFLLSISPGINIITIYFSVGYCTDKIIISAIRTKGNGVNFGDQLPENTLCWFTWENCEIDYSFDLSSLKPLSTNQNQVLEYSINYGCIGEVVEPFISYEIFIGTETIASGEISGSAQTNSPQSLNGVKIVTNFFDSIVMTIQGTTTGQGAFYILNTSKITINPIHELSEEVSLERELVESENYITPLLSPLILTFMDYFILVPNSLYCSINLSFDLTTEQGLPVRQVDIQLKLNFQTSIDEQIKEEKNIWVAKNVMLFSKSYEVTIVISIYGDGHTVILENLKYLITSISNSNVTITNPFDTPNEEKINDIVFNPSKSTIIYLEFGFLLLALTILISQIWSNSKRMKNEATESITEIQFDSPNIRRGRIRKFVSEKILLISESILKSTLLFLSLGEIVLKTIVLFQITNEVITIAQNNLEEIVFLEGGKWCYYIFIICIYALSFTGFSTIYLSYSNIFYEDFYKVTKFLSIAIKIVLVLSFIGSLIFIKLNSANFEGFWNVVLPIIAIVVIVMFTWLGRIKDKQFKLFLNNFFKTGTLHVTKNSLRNPKESNSISESEISTEERDKLKSRLKHMIISDSKPGIQLSSTIVAEFLNIEKVFAHRLLIEISNELPRLGKYHELEQIYIKNSDSEIENIIINSTLQENNIETENIVTRINELEEGLTIIPMDETGNIAQILQNEKGLLNTHALSQVIFFISEVMIPKIDQTDNLDLRSYEIKSSLQNFRDNKQSFYSDNIIDFVLNFLTDATKNQGDIEKLLRFKFLFEEFTQISDQIKEHSFENKAFLQIGRVYHDLVEAKGNEGGLQTLKGETPFFDIIFSLERYIYACNTKLGYCNNLEDKIKKWKEFQTKLSYVFGVIDFPFLGNIVQKKLELNGNNVTVNTKNGVFLFDIEKGIISLDKKSLELTNSSLNIEITDLKSYYRFLDSRYGTDLDLDNGKIESKNYKQSGISKLINGYSLKSTGIAKQLLLGVLRLPIIVNGKIIDFTKIIKKKNSYGKALAVTKKILSMYISGQGFTNLRRSAINNHKISNEISGSRTRQSAVKNQLISLVFDHIYQKIVFIETTSTDEKFTTIFPISTYMRDSTFKTKLHIPNGYYPSVDLHIIAEVLGKSHFNVISSKKSIKFAFSTYSKIERLNKKTEELVVIGFMNKNTKKDEIRYIVYEDLINSYKRIKRNPNIDVQMEQLYWKTSNCTFGKEQKVTINEKNTISTSELVIYDFFIRNARGSWIRDSLKDRLLSIASFWEPIKIQRNNIEEVFVLTFIDEKKQQIFEKTISDEKEIFPGAFYFSRGINRIHPSTSNKPPIETIKSVKEVMFRFVTTGQLPTVFLFSFKDNHIPIIDFVDARLAIVELKRIRKLITKENRTLKENGLLSKVFECLKKVGAVKGMFRLSKLSTKIDDTIDYYEEIITYYPRLVSFTNSTINKKNEIIPLLENGLPIIRPLFTTHFWSFDHLQGNEKQILTILKNYKEAFNSVNKGLIHFDGKVLNNCEEESQIRDVIDDYKKWRSVAMESTDLVIIRRKTNREFVSKFISNNNLANNKILEFWKKGFVGKKLRILVQRIQKIFKLGITLPYNSQLEYFLFNEKMRKLLDGVCKKATIQLKHLSHQLSERRFDGRKGHVIKEIVLKDIRRNELLEKMLDSNMINILKQRSSVKLYYAPCNSFPNIVNRKIHGKYDSISFKEFIYSDTWKRQIIINEITLRHYIKILQMKNHKLTVSINQKMNDNNIIAGVSESLELLLKCLSVAQKFKRERLLKKKLPKGMSIREGYRQEFLGKGKIVPITRNLVVSRSSLSELSVALEIALIFHFIYHAHSSYGEILLDMIKTNVNDDQQIGELEVNDSLQKEKLYLSNQFDGESLTVYEMKWDKKKQAVICNHTNKLTLRKAEQLDQLLTTKMFLPGALTKNKDIIVNNVLESDTMEVLEEKIRQWELLKSPNKNKKSTRISKKVKKTNYRQFYDWINKLT